jgi:phage N-6-adenine-methyltransferase
MSVHFSSKFHEWETPQDLFDRVDALLQFDIDLAANSQNAKLSRYLDEAMDALREDWSCIKRGWLNPPYGRGIIKWMAKAFASNTTIACLVPARTDTK